MSKIGIYDSGLGGLHVYEKLKQSLPQIPFVYFGDNAYMPLSDKSQNEIKNRVASVVEYLFKEQDCALVLLACNTASVVAVRYLQQEWMPEQKIFGKNVLGINIVAIEQMSEEYPSLRDKKGLVLMTPTTAQTQVYQERLAESGFKDVTGLGMPDLAAAIESQDVQRITTAIETPMNQSHIDPETIQYVLFACTHYPIIADVVRTRFKEDTVFIDPSEAVGTKLGAYLAKHPQFTFDGAEDTFLMSKVDPQFIETAKKLFQKERTFRAVTV